MTIIPSAFLLVLLISSFIASIASQTNGNFSTLVAAPAASATVSALLISDNTGRTFTIQARNNLSQPIATGGDFFFVELYSNSPACIPSAATPNCFPTCAPRNVGVHVAPGPGLAPACASSFLTDSSTSAGPHYVPASVTDLGTGQYSVVYYPEYKGRYDIFISQLQAGGLNANYYDNVWFLAPAAITRVDSIINFQWGTGLVSVFGVDYVSIRWSGKIRPPTSETFTIYSTADDWIRVWIDNRLVISNAWGGSCCNETFGNVAFTANYFHDIVIEYVELRGSASVSLSWSSPTIPKTIVNANYLFSRVNLPSSPVKNISILAADPPSKILSFVNDTGSTALTATGGLSAAVAGIQGQFLFTAVDSFGNQMDSASSQSSVPFLNISGPDPTASYSSSHIGSGVYLVKYLLKVVGAHTITVNTLTTGNVLAPLTQIGNTGNAGQYSVVVTPGAFNLSRSNTSIPSSGSIALTANVGYSFTIFCRDSQNNLRVGQPSYEIMNVLLTRTSDGLLKNGFSIYSQSTGTFTAGFTLSLSGTYQLSVFVNNTLLSQIFTFIIASGPLLPAFSTVNLPALATSVTSNVQSNFTFTTLDNGRNVISSGLASNFFSFSLVSDSQSSYSLSADSIVSSGSGIYTVFYTPRRVGSFTGTIFNGSAVLSAKSYKFSVGFGSVFGNNSMILNAPSIGQVGISLSFQVLTKDFNSNIVDARVLTVGNFNITLVNSGYTGLTMNYWTGGIYNFTITPSSTGSATLFVSILTSAAPQTVANNLPAISIVAGPAAATFTSASGAAIGAAIVPASLAAASVLNNQFLLTTYDSSNNPVSTSSGSALWNVRVQDRTSPSDYYFTNSLNSSLLTVQDLNTGIYQVNYLLKRSGSYQLLVELSRSGGLIGQYYSDLNFLTQSASQLDSTINFNYQYSVPLSAILSPNFFSIKWTGKLKSPNQSGSYKFIFQLSYNNIIKYYFNGKLLLDNSNIQSGLFGLTEISTPIVLLSANTLYDIQIEFYSNSLNGANSIVFLWQQFYAASSALATKTVIESKYLYYSQNITGSPFSVSVNPGASSAASSYSWCATNANNSYAAGIPISCTMQLVDIWGNNQTTTTETASVAGSMTYTGTNITTIAASVANIGPGLYSLTFTPTVSGSPVISFTFGAASVRSLLSSTSFPVLATSYSSFNATVLNLQTSLIAGFSTSFQIQFRDFYGNLINSDVTTPISQFSAFLYSGLITNVVTTITNISYVDSGLYSFTYTPTTSGSLSLVLRLGGVALANSPYAIAVAGDSAVSSTSKLVTGPFNVTSGSASTIGIVSVFDSFGNAINSGTVAAQFYISINKNGLIYRPTATAAGAASHNYSVSLTGPSGNNGVYQLTILLANMRYKGLTGAYYNNRWLQGSAAATRIDPAFSSTPTSTAALDYNWSATQLITPTANLYVSVVWSGYLLVPVAGNVTLALNNDDGSRLWFEGSLLIDQWNSQSSNSTYSSWTIIPTANQLYSVTVNYRQNIGSAFIRLMWNIGSGLVTIPLANSYPTADAVTNTPADLSVV